jgi:spermidine synthase
VPTPAVTRAPLREAAPFDGGLQVLVLVSGAAALVYQSVWIRQLSLILGSTTYAVGTVLAAFMAGLGVGAFCVGRRADRTPRPLALYAALELGIGLVGLVSPLALGQGNELYASFYRRWHDAPALLTMARFAIGFAFVFVPAFLMGGTLPAATRHLVLGGRSVGPAVGRLYAVNTFGAACGALLLPYALLPALGVRRTLLATAATNLTLAAAALSGARDAPTPSPAVPANAAVVGPRRPALLVAFFVSGFVALALEVLWNRFFSMFIGSSIYSYAIVLTLYLVGIFAGGLVCERLMTAGHAAERIVVAALGTVLVALAVGIPMLDRVLYPQVAVLDTLGLGFWSFQIAALAALALVVLPPTIGFGASFPAVAAALARGAGDAGRTIGLVYLVNTAGTTLGSVIASFVLVPFLGLRGSFGVLTALVAVAVLLAASPARRRHIGFVLAVAGLAVVPAVAPAWNLRRLNSTINNDARTIIAAWQAGTLDESLAQMEVLDLRDGVDATVSVTRYVDGELGLLVNGKGDASDGVDMFTQVLLGHLPLAVRPDAREVLVVGMGSGVTVGAVLRHPVAHVDLVEIAPEVLELGGRHFRHVNHGALEDARVTVHVEDGRNFIAFTDDRTWDVIVSEPSNPWMTGVANLFTTEFFASARKRLRPGGILAQWFHHYGMALDDVRALLATVRVHFPYVYVFAFHHTLDVTGDMVLLASEAPIDFGPALEALAGGVVADDLRPFGIDGPASLPLGFVLGPGSLEPFVADTAINSDDHPRIELNAPRNLLSDTAFDNIEALMVASNGAILPTTQGVEAARPTGEPTEARAVASGLRLLVDDTRAPTGFRQREVITQVTYEAEGRTLRVLSADGVRDAAGLEKLAGRLAGGSITRTGGSTVGGHAAERYRAADGSDVVVWGCPSRRASFVALGDAAVLAHVTCH